jgi:hypothetical protein
MQTVIFERVYSGPHPVLIEAKGHGANKGRGRQAARAAEQRRGRAGRRRGQAVAAAHTGKAALGWKLSPAGVTNWREGELRQGGTAEGTDGRKEGATQGIHGTSEHTGHRAPPGSLRWWNVERQ